MVGVGESQLLSGSEGEGIHQVGRVAIVGQQYPVFFFVQSQYGSFFIEFHAVGLLGIPQPSGVPSSPDASGSFVVPLRMVRFDGQCEVYVMLFLFSEYRCMVFGFDGQLGHAEGVVLFFRSQFRTFVVVVRTSCQHPWKADEAYPMSDFHSGFFLAAK